MSAKQISPVERMGLQAGRVVPIRIVGEDRTGFTVAFDSKIPKQTKEPYTQGRIKSNAPNPAIKQAIHNFTPPPSKKHGSNPVENYLLEEREKELIAHGVNPNVYKREYFKVDLDGKRPQYVPIKGLAEDQPVYVKKGSSYSARDITATTPPRGPDRNVYDHNPISPDQLLMKAKQRPGSLSLASSPTADDTSSTFDTNSDNRLLLNNIKTGLRLEGVVAHSTPYNAFINCKVYRRGKAGYLTEVQGMLNNEDIPSEVKKIARKEYEMELLRNNEEINEFKIPLLPKGAPLTVYVKEVLKQAGRFTLTLDPEMSKEKLMAKKQQVKEEGTLRRRIRRLKRQLDPLYAGDLLTGYVSKIIPEGVLLNITSLGKMNVTGIIAIHDLPQQFHLPKDLPFDGKREFLGYEFKKHRAIDCYVDKINPLPSPLLEYNLGLLFQGFSTMKNTQNLHPFDDEDDLHDEHDNNGSRVQDERFEEIEGLRVRHAGSNKSGLSGSGKKAADFFSVKKDEDEDDDESENNFRYDGSFQDIGDMEEVEKVNQLAKQLAAADEKKSGSASKVKVQQTSNNKMKSQAEIIQEIEKDENEEIGFDANEVDEEDYVDEDVSEIYDELRGEKPMLHIDDIFAWSDIQDKFTERVLSPQSIIKAIQSIPIPDTAQITKVQFSDLITLIQDEMEAYEAKQATKQPEPVNQKASKPVKPVANEAPKKSVEPQESKTNKATSKQPVVEESPKPKALKSIEPEVASVESLTQEQIEQVFTPEEILRKQAENDALFDKFIQKHPEHSAKPLSEEEIIDESVDEVINEVYDELRGKREFLTLAQFKGWEDIQDLYKEELLNDELISQCCQELQIKNQQSITLSQFRLLLDKIEEMIQDEEEDEDQNAEEGNDEGESEDDEEDTNVIDGVADDDVVKEEKDNNDQAQQVHDADEKEDGEDIIDGDDKDEDEEQSVVQEIFEELQNKHGKVTVKAILEWEEMKDMIENNVVTMDLVLLTFQEILHATSIKNIQQKEVTVEQFREVLVALDTMAAYTEDDLEDQDDDNVETDGDDVETDGEDIETDENDENVAVSREEMLTVYKQNFKSMSKNKGKTITLKALYGSDDVVGLMEEKYLTMEQVQQFITKVGIPNNRKEMNVDEYIKFMDLIDEHLDIYINKDTVDMGSVEYLSIDQDELQSKAEVLTKNLNDFSKGKEEQEKVVKAMKPQASKIETSKPTVVKETNEVEKPILPPNLEGLMTPLEPGYEIMKDENDYTEEDDILYDEDYRREFNKICTEVSKHK